MDKINLEKIFRTSTNGHKVDTLSDLIADAKDDDVLAAMKEACRQVLERAADNACVDKIRLGISIASEYAFVVNRESILNTINEVE